MRLGWAGLVWGGGVGGGGGGVGGGGGGGGLGWGLREIMICGGQNSRGFPAQRILIYTDRGGGEEERKHNNIIDSYLVA